MSCGSHGSCRILVVDDDEGMRENLAELFEALGYGVLTAATAPEALALLAHADVDLVITDYRMPGFTGIELIDAVRRTHPRVLAVLMTAFGDDCTEDESLRRGAAGYISKPFEADAMASLVQKVVAGAGEASG